MHLRITLTLLHVLFLVYPCLANPIDIYGISGVRNLGLPYMQQYSRHQSYSSSISAAAAASAASIDSAAQAASVLSVQSASTASTPVSTTPAASTSRVVDEGDTVVVNYDRNGANAAQVPSVSSQLGTPTTTGGCDATTNSAGATVTACQDGFIWRAEHDY